MTWLDALTQIEDLEDADFDAELVAEFERRADVAVSRPIRFSTPTFKEYETSELEGCGKNSFPAFSITAGWPELRPLPEEDPRADDPGDESADARREGPAPH